MKKYLLLFSLLAGLFVSHVGASQASQLYVNEAHVAGVEVISFSFEAGVLRLQTNVGLVVPGSEGGSGGEGSATLQLTASSYSLVGSQTTVISLAFGSAVVDFDVNDIDVSGGTIGQLSSNGNTYTAVLTPDMASTSISVGVDGEGYSFQSGSDGVSASINIAWTEESSGGGDTEGCGLGNVTCTEPLNWSGGESRTTFTVPKGETLAMPLMTTAGVSFEGSVSFQNISLGGAREVWFSESPGGEQLMDGRNDRFCKVAVSSGLYGLHWKQGSGRADACNLKVSTQYYLNIRNTSAETGASSVWRTRTNNGRP